MGKTIEKIESVAKTLNGRHMPKPYEVYKHFKGNLYVVLNVARHTETNELFVVYAATKEMQRIYARPLEMFMSEVDHEKYDGGLIYDRRIFKRIIHWISSWCNSNDFMSGSERKG